MKQSIILAAVLCLTGCGIADHFNAQGRMDEAEKDYRKCLNSNVAKPDVCEPLKQVWQTDKTAYETGNY